jgi:glutathione synthase/RimK-type ligase-like ATP-grasp enzyme
MPAQLVFGVLISQSWARQLAEQQDLYDARMYALAAQHSGIYVYFFRRKDIDFTKRSIRGWVPHPDGRWVYQAVPWPNVYYDQVKIASLNNTRAYRKLHRLLNNSSIPLNPVNLLAKWKCHLALSQFPDTSELLPETILCQDTRSLKKMLTKHQVILAKPDAGSRGEGICRIWRSDEGRYNIHLAEEDTPEQLRHLQEIYLLCTVYAGRQKVLLQQEIPLARASEDERCDMRISVAKNRQGTWEVTQSYLRAGRPGKFITNWSQGARCVTLQEGLTLIGIPLDSIEQAKTNIFATAVRVATRLEQSLGRMAEMGIDLALDNSHRLWLLEANATPNKGSQPDDTWDPVPKIFKNVLEYAQYLWEREKL